MHGSVSKRRRGVAHFDVGAGGATSCSMYAASLLSGSVGYEDEMRYFRPRTATETEWLTRGVRRRRGGVGVLSSARLHYARLEVVCSPAELDADLIAMRGGTVRRTALDVDSLFERCADTKGWVRCVGCGSVQWPPNREKHLAKCPGLMERAEVVEMGREV